MRKILDSNGINTPQNPEAVPSFYVSDCDKAIGLAYQFYRYLDGGANVIGEDVFPASAVAAVYTGPVSERLRCKDGIFKIDDPGRGALEGLDVSAILPGYVSTLGDSKYIEARCVLGKLSTAEDELEIFVGMSQAAMVIGNFPTLAAGASFLFTGGIGPNTALPIIIRKGLTPVAMIFVTEDGIQEALFTLEGRRLFAIKGGGDTFSNVFGIGLDNDPYLISIMPSEDISFDIYTEGGVDDTYTYIGIEWK